MTTNSDIKHWKRFWIPEIARVFLMNVEFAYGSREKAVDMAKNLAEDGTPFPVAHLNYATHLASLGRADEALALLGTALRLRPKRVARKNILLTTATCRWLAGDIGAAIATLEAMRAEFSYLNPSALTTLGYMYFLRGDYERAEAASKEALEESPGFAAAWDNLGQISYRQRRLDEARGHFMKALELKPDLADSNYYMGAIEEERGDIASAAGYFSRAAECPVTAFNTVTMDEIVLRRDMYKDVIT